MIVATDWTGIVVDIEAGILAALAVFWTIVRLFGRSRPVEPESPPIEQEVSTLSSDSPREEPT